MSSSKNIRPILRRESGRVKKAKDRTRQAGGKNRLSPTDWLEILRDHMWLCAFCGRDEITMEHLIPLRMGGNTDKSNCVPACRRCNEGFSHSARHGVN